MYKRQVRFTPARPPVAPLTAMCCVRAHREASGRIWYRITATPDIATDERKAEWVRGEPSDVLADVRAFLLDVGPQAPI